MMEPVARIDAEALKELEKHPGASATVWSGKASHRFALDAVPLVRLSDAEARIKELELDLRIAIEQRNMTLTEMQRHMDRAEAAEALLKEAGDKALEAAANEIMRHAKSEMPITVWKFNPWAKGRLDRITRLGPKWRAKAFIRAAAAIRALKEKP